MGVRAVAQRPVHEMQRHAQVRPPARAGPPTPRKPNSTQGIEGPRPWAAIVAHVFRARARIAGSSESDTQTGQRREAEECPLQPRIARVAQQAARARPGR